MATETPIVMATGANPRFGPSQSILQSLVTALLGVMRYVVADRSTQRFLPDEDHFLQALLLDRTDEALPV